MSNALSPSSPSPEPQAAAAVAFISVEAAWFWAVRALRGHCAGPAPCRLEDILKCLDTLYRNRRIDLLHVRILHIWGRRGVAPHPNRSLERSDSRVWREAMSRLEGPLRARGIVAGHRPSGEQK